MVHNWPRLDGSANPSGATPMIVNGCPSILSVRPIAPGSELSRVVQYPLLTTTVAGAPGSSSPLRQRRPTAALTPRVSKNCAVADVATTASAAPAFETATVWAPVYAATVAHA